MEKYSFRIVMHADIENVYALTTEQNKFDYGSAVTTMKNLQKIWQEGYLEASTCVATMDSELVGYAELMDGEALFIYLADRSNVNLASKLLKNLEKKVTQQNIEPIDIGTRVSEKNQTSYRFSLPMAIQRIILFSSWN
jgi:hypothetical protein